MLQFSYSIRYINPSDFQRKILVIFGFNLVYELLVYYMILSNFNDLKLKPSIKLPPQLLSQDHATLSPGAVRL